MSDLVRRLHVVFGDPSHTEDAAGFLTELARLIRGHPADVQNRAADVLIRTHKPSARRPWPAPSEIAAACADVADAVAAQQRPAHDHPWSDRRKRKATDLIVCRLGQQAADEGWITALWDFCRKHERLPNEHEVHRCRVSAKEFDEAFASFCANPGVLAAPLRAGFEKRFARRDVLGRIAWGEVIEGFQP